MSSPSPFHICHSPYYGSQVRVMEAGVLGPDPGGQGPKFESINEFCRGLERRSPILSHARRPRYYYGAT